MIYFHLNFEFATIDMEDAHTHILTMKEDKDAAFFAVFDGHGGLFIQISMLKLIISKSKFEHKF